MTYLYGDSTESGLELNYIEFLKAVLEFSVQVLLADHRIQTFAESAEDKKRLADVELDELRQVAEAVRHALETMPGTSEGAAARCAAAIRAASLDAVKKGAGAVKAQLAEQLASMTQQAHRERGVAGRALEGFLLHHDLPSSTRHHDLALDRTGAHYVASMRGRADIGFDWVLGLAIPDGSVFAQPLKLERIAPHLEIRVPESGGFLRKGVRMKTQKLGGHYLLELSHSAQQTTYKLRAAPQEEEAGYNVLVVNTAPPIRLVRVGKGGDHSPPFEPLDDDVPRLLELTAQLRVDVSALADHRQTLLEANLDGKPLAEHEAPSIAVRRLLAKIAPTVEEIARRSLSSEELVLKRVLADDRREEIFIARADLEARLAPLPLGQRALFVPLGLGGSLAAAEPAGEASGRLDSVEGEVDVATKEIFIGRPAAAPVDLDEPTSIGVDDTEGAAETPDPQTVELDRDDPELEIGDARDLDGAHPAEPAAREHRDLPRASEVFRRSANIAAVRPTEPKAVVPRPASATPAPGNDDDDVTMVATAPPKPTGQGAAVVGETTRPPAAPGTDSVDAALSELEREND